MNTITGGGGVHRFADRVGGGSSIPGVGGCGLSPHGARRAHPVNGPARSRACRPLAKRLPNMSAQSVQSPEPSADGQSAGVGLMPTSGDRPQCRDPRPLPHLCRAESSPGLSGSITRSTASTSNSRTRTIGASARIASASRSPRMSTVGPSSAARVAPIPSTAPSRPPFTNWRAGCAGAGPPEGALRRQDAGLLHHATAATLDLAEAFKPGAAPEPQSHLDVDDHEAGQIVRVKGTPGQADDRR